MNQFLLAAIPVGIMMMIVGFLCRRLLIEEKDLQTSNKNFSNKKLIEGTHEKTDKK